MKHLKSFLKLVLVVIIAEKVYCWTSGSRNLIFNKLGQYGSKTYYVPKNIKSNWDACRRICKDSKLDFAHFDSKAEADYVFGVFVSYNGTVNMTAFVDGVTTVPGQKTGWYWIKPNTLIDYISGMTWTLYEPDNFANDQYCLGIQKLNSTVGWTDANCYGNANATAVGPQSCICQG